MGCERAKNGDYPRATYEHAKSSPYYLNVARKSQSILKDMNKQWLIKRRYVENRK